MKQLTYLLLTIAALLVFCQRHDDAPHRGIYHWKTTYNPTEWEKKWMKKHKVDKLYIKLFDVEAGEKVNEPDWKMVPTATTEFKQPLPKEMDVVPVVYITVDAIRALDEDGNWFDPDDKRLYAKLIVKRIDAMMAEHYDGMVHEMQLDCDWTARTKKSYFQLANEVKELLHERNITLSGTLRLHQLREVEIPKKASYWDDEDTIPFDRSLLMCYNTGRLQDPDTKNSILEFDDVKPYLKQYHHNNLPRTDVAYPVYGWGVQFDEKGAFQRIVNSRHLPQQRDRHTREEWGEASEIQRTQKALPMLDTVHTVILYHLDSLNLSRYSHEDIEAFYSK